MASGHFTWLRNVPEALGVNPAYAGEAEKFIWALLLGSVLVLGAKRASSRLRLANIGETDLIPHSTFSFFSFFEFFTDAFTKYHDSILGKEGRRYLPLTASVFTFLLFANLIGLIPGVAAITTTVWINVGLALVVFVYFNYLGFKHQGIWGYLKHFCGPVWSLPFVLALPLGLGVFALEILSTLIRVLTLNLRLYWNISADHIILETFTGLTPYVVPIVFYALGTFVCFMQAFIFSTLTMIYVVLVTQHEEGEH